MPISKTRKEAIIFFRWLAIMTSFVGPASMVPQLKKVWSGNNEGVSVITWSLFLLSAFIWLLFGITNRQKVIIFQYLLYFIIEGLIVLKLVV